MSKPDSRSSLTRQPFHQRRAGRRRGGVGRGPGKRRRLGRRSRGPAAHPAQGRRLPPLPPPAARRIAAAAARRGKTLRRDHQFGGRPSGRPRRGAWTARAHDFLVLEKETALGGFCRDERRGRHIFSVASAYTGIPDTRRW